MDNMKNMIIGSETVNIAMDAFARHSRENMHSISAEPNISTAQ